MLRCGVLRLCRLMCGKPPAFRENPAALLEAQAWEAKPLLINSGFPERHSLSAHQTAEPFVYLLPIRIGGAFKHNGSLIECQTR